MTASDHLGPQLRMFMTAQELRLLPSHDQKRWRERGGGEEAMWKSKGEDNLVNKVPESIAEHGVMMPVTLGRGERDFGGATVIEHGHHRILAAFEQDPQMYLPVEHKDYDRRYRPTVAEENEYARQLDSIPGWTEHNYFPSYP